MVYRGTRVLVVAAAISGLCGMNGSVTPALPVAVYAQGGKLDPAVVTEMTTGRSQRVLVLGSSQLFAPVGGLASFVGRHVDEDRRALRRTLIADLRRLATEQQPRILAALGKQEAERRLWVVNALVLTLTPDELRRAAELSDVAYVYALREVIPQRVDTAGVSANVPGAVPLPGGHSRPRVPWNLVQLGADTAWREGATGRGVTVMVLDEGVNYLHEDLRENLWRNARELPNNHRDDDGNGYVDDLYGFDFARMRPEVRDVRQPFQHGTITAGIVAGNGRGGIVTGVAPDAKLMVGIGTTPTAAALAMQYALENGADIVSMSFSIPDLGSVRGVWRAMSDHATAAGLLLIGGAGNFRSTHAVPDQIWGPKDAPSVMAVGGVDQQLRRASFSSGGPVTWSDVPLYGDFPMPTGLMKPDVTAFPGPGYPVLGPSDTGYIDPNPRIAGNSLSGPHGAGVAALVMSAAPEAPVWQVREAMERTARDLGRAGPDDEFGHGLLNAPAAVRAIRARRR